ncbi:BQ5605_C002g00988 [Microbotryum silenes-dioicae]|uniref:BQ5605_C002g00988 protein n=1 Tax=Microbotryum silenes-dioicae TaxID=796604 RepID=A0A2X0P0T2_9BASI|nr:BQ5605_C002g00988 [Microbotryum silenes-dioicae]
MFVPFKMSNSVRRVLISDLDIRSLGTAGSASTVEPSSSSRQAVFFLFNWAHKLRSFGLARIATKRAKRGNKATTTSSWVKIKPLRAASAAQIKTRRAPNADSNER